MIPHPHPPTSLFTARSAPVSPLSLPSSQEIRTAQTFAAFPVHYRIHLYVAASFATADKVTQADIESRAPMFNMLKSRSDDQRHIIGAFELLCQASFSLSSSLFSPRVCFFFVVAFLAGAFFLICFVGVFRRGVPCGSGCGFAPEWGALVYGCMCRDQPRGSGQCALPRAHMHNLRCAARRSRPRFFSTCASGGGCDGRLRKLERPVLFASPVTAVSSVVILVLVCRLHVCCTSTT